MPKGINYILSILIGALLSIASMEDVSAQSDKTVCKPSSPYIDPEVLSPSADDLALDALYDAEQSEIGGFGRRYSNSLRDGLDPLEFQKQLTPRLPEFDMNAPGNSQHIDLRNKKYEIHAPKIDANGRTPRIEPFGGGARPGAGAGLSGAPVGAAYELFKADSSHGRDRVGSALAELRDRYPASICNPQDRSNRDRIRDLEEYVHNWGPSDWPFPSRDNQEDLRDRWQDRGWHEMFTDPFDFVNGKSIDEEYPPGQYRPVMPNLLPAPQLKVN